MGRWREIGWVGAVVLWALAGLGGTPAEGAKWSRAYINALPDEAFAAVEEGPDGTRARHLPHHDAHGRVDLPHLRSALSRLNQVRWADPANAARAREHLLEHYRALGLPGPGDGGARHGRARQRFVPRPQMAFPGASIVAGAVHPRSAAPSRSAAGPRHHR